MKKFWRIFLIVLVVAAFIGTFFFLWNKTRPVKVVYEIVEPKTDTINQFIIATGKIEPRDEVLIKPQISGIISAVYKEAGMKVRKGEVIATVKVVPDMSALNSAESRVNQADIDLRQTEREFERTKSLYDQSVITPETYEKGQTELLRAQESLQSAKDNLEIVLNGITSRNAELSNTQIRSTVDGMILDIPVKVGNSVIQSNTFNDGTTIASIADMSDMIFRGTVDETDVGKLNENVPVKLTIGALQNIELDATLEYVSPKATEENNIIKFEVKAAVGSAPDVFVRAGYSANASILIQTRQNVLTIPESVISWENAKPYVYVMTSAEETSEQTFEQKPVELGLSNGVIIEVVNGITLNDKLRGAARRQDKTK